MSEFSRNLAFIIGINNYTNGISPLQNAVNDAKKLVEILREKHEYQVWVCLDEVATLNNLNKLLEKILPEQVTENDRLLFYFAGHGIALNGDDGPAGYLIPQDAKLGDVQTYLPMAKLQESLNKLPCRHFLGILDCCFAGAFRWSSNRDLLTAPEVIHKERYDRFITDPAWQVITSAASDQKALDAFALNAERRQIGDHSPFAAALIEALAGKADVYPPSSNGKPPGDGVITATELYLYLRDAVEPATEGNRQRQTPGIHQLKKHDKGEYIFLSPGHPLNLPPAPPLDASKNPYRGLKSYDEKHSELFFGRTELVEKLQNFVKIHPLTVVLGASGSGKSSLVKAGLIPELRKDNTEQWRIIPPIRPGDTPMLALNNALKDAQLPEVAAQNPQHNLARSINVWAKNNPNSKLLLVIDQGEEIITLCQNEDERKEFFQQILKAINAHPHRLRVVLTLRSDFEPQVRDAGLKCVPTVLKLGNTMLKNRWHTGRFIVPAMTRGDLREAIEKPAEARMMYFQPHELVEQLIDEVADMPGALPLLSFALSELYLKYLKRQRDAENGGITIDRSLTQQDYQDLGGVIQSLTQKADEEYEMLVKEDLAYKQIIRHVMLRMVAIGGGELARRQVPLSELEYPGEKNDLVKTVINRFTEARLLVQGKDAEGNSYVEPADDALVRGWQKLLSWVKEEKNLRLQRRLTSAALEWKSQQQPRFLWNVDPYLDVLEKEVLNSENNNWLNKVETEFVQQSIGKKSFNTKKNWGIAIAVILGLSGLTIAALIGQRNAQISQIRASRQSSEANLRSNQELDALIESLRAGKSLKQPFLQLFKPDNEIQNQLKETLQKAVYQVKERNRLKGGQDNISSVGVSFSPDGQRLATAGDDGTVRLLNLHGQPLKEWNAHQVTTMTFSPNSQILATAGDDGTVRLWNLHGQLLKEINTDQGWVRSVSFSPNGQLLATAGATGTIRLWNLQGQPLKKWKADEGWIWNASFSPDGQQLAAVGASGIVRLWDLQGQLLIGRKASQFPLRSVSFSRDGQLLATAGDDGIARLWNLQGQMLRELKGDQRWTWNVSFSPDGQLLATAGDNGTVGLWNLRGKLLAQLKGNQGVLRSVSFSRDGQLLATAGDSDTAHLWDLRGQPLPLTELKGKPDSVTSVILSHDGQQLATAEDDGTIRIWNLQGQPLAVWKANQRSVKKVILSQDTQQLVTAEDDGTIRVWNLQGQQLAAWKGDQLKVINISLSHDGRRVATVGDDGIARVWDLQGHPLAVFQGHQRKITSVSFSPDGQRLASIEEDDKVHLRDLQGKQLAEEPLGHPNGLQSVSFSPDSQRLAAAGDDGIVRVWNLQGQPLTKQLSVWQSTQRLIWYLKFSPDSQRLATAGYDGTVRLWDLQGQPLATWKVDQGKVWSISFSRDGQQMATAGYSGNAKLLRIESFDDLMQGGCNWVRDYLQNNPNVNESDRHLCDGVSKVVVKDKSF
jgi:WD40 repeat protein